VRKREKKQAKISKKKKQGKTERRRRVCGG